MASALSASTFGYEKFWISALLYSAPVLTMPHSNILLALLHRALLLKFRVMRAFPVVMRGAPTAIGGAGAQSLEIESGV